MPIITSAQLTNPDSAISWFNNMNPNLITAGYTSDANPVPYVRIADIFEVRDFIENDFQLFVHGERVSWVARYWSVPMTTVIYDGDLVYMYFQSVWGGQLWGLTCCIVYNRISNLILYGYRVADSSSNPIETMQFYDDNTQLQYSYKSVFTTYSTQLGHIDYTQKRLFEGNIKILTIVPNMLDCSTVTERSIISFNEHNYFAIGTHTLVQVDIQ